MKRLAWLLGVVLVLVIARSQRGAADPPPAPVGVPSTASASEPPVNSPGCRTTWERSHRLDDRLPPDGTPVVGGIALPRGSRCQGYWATDGPVEDPIGLAKRLAAKFPETGLWPLVWDDSADPDELAFPPEDPAIADGRDALTELRGLHKELSAGETLELRALAAGNPERDSVDPFDRLAAIWATYPPSGSGCVIVLVPVKRPSDAVAITGFPTSGVVPPRVLATVARSWEERFGAVPVTASLGGLGFAVSGPPSEDQMQALAIEQGVFAPDSDRDWQNRHFWGFGWPD